MEQFWQLLSTGQGELFYTAKGLPFSYVLRGGELFIDRKQKSITKATVAIALQRAEALQGTVPGPKKLGVFGASYLYPIFVHFGIIKKEAS